MRYALATRAYQTSSGCLSLTDGSGWQLCGLFADPLTLTPGAFVSAGFDLSIYTGGAYDEVFAGEVLDQYGNVVALFPAREFATGVLDQNGIMQYPPPSSPSAVVTPLNAPSNTNVFFAADRPLPASIQAGQAIFILLGPASLFAGDEVGQQSGAWSFMNQLVLAAQATVQPGQGTVVQPTPPPVTPPSGTPPPPAPKPAGGPPTQTHQSTAGKTNWPLIIGLGAGAALFLGGAYYVTAPR